MAPIARRADRRLQALLMAAALAQSSDRALQRLCQFRRPANAAELIDTFFADLAEWAAKPRWSGGGFTRAVIELADMSGHPARAIARKHKAAVENWLAESLVAAEIASARERAREIMLLMEGAMALMLIHGSRDFASAAAKAAKTLVRQA